ncbi:hypothetical protein FIBSPDRAFT_926290 [Athelia psychrophila]|uniref:NB-ARC domain-containing protein n=1 Tax=Athelia psychrophila TaxID=1759441 RepID=A0A166TQ57_9AGAM|nr:hypothetical protein FIBSPDRAFT_926290 [Fibularhizoctonia sp. CBS 109695]
MLRLLQPSDYVCAASVASHEARRWLEDAQPGIMWLLIVDDVALDSVDCLRTHLPRRNRSGDILFVTQSEVVAKALADEGHDNVLEVGPLARDDAVQLLFKKTGVVESGGLLKEARSIVERLGRLPVPIHQAASFVKHFQGDLKCLTSLLQEGRGTVLSRWDTRLTGYEHTTYEGMVQAQLARLASDRPQAAELLKVLCYLDPSGISLPILVDGARLLRSAPTKTSKLPQFMSKLRRPKLSPSDLDHPLSALLSTIALQDELHNLVRCLQHISLVRLETDRPTDVASDAETPKGQPSHILRIPDLVRKIVRGGKGKDEESACFGMTVGIIVSAFVQRIHDPSLWSPLIKHITSLSHWDWEFVRDHPQARLEATFRAALSHAIKIIAGFDRKILERKLKTDRQLFERRITHSLEQCGF